MDPQYFASKNESLQSLHRVPMKLVVPRTTRKNTRLSINIILLKLKLHTCMCDTGRILYMHR